MEMGEQCLSACARHVSRCGVAADRYRKARHHGNSTWTRARGVHSAPGGAHTLQAHKAHLQLENHTTAEPSEQPLLEITKVPHILEMLWHDVRELGRYKLDSLAGRHFGHSEG
eukprot:1159452-Pelagomonas_calceolata.AAC.3